ncbi:hypothetical protein EBZ57_01935 [bacterium]|jgi:hypothetical protein|nr:hypothetical protein [bacterium]
MYTYIILGQIPGTNVHISFQVWVILTIMAIVFGPSIYRYFTEDLSTDKNDQDAMHASRLHLRAK